MKKIVIASALALVTSCPLAAMSVQPNEAPHRTQSTDTSAYNYNEANQTIETDKKLSPAQMENMAKLSGFASGYANIQIVKMANVVGVGHAGATLNESEEARNGYQDYCARNRKLKNEPGCLNVNLTEVGYLDGVRKCRADQAIDNELRNALKSGGDPKSVLVTHLRQAVNEYTAKMDLPGGFTEAVIKEATAM